MRESARIYLLRLLALIQAAAFIYPAVVMLRAILFYEDGGLFSVLLFVLLLSVGFIAGRLLFSDKLAILSRISELGFIKPVLFTLDIKDKKHYLAAAVSVSTFFIPVVIAISSYSDKGIIRVVFESLTALAAYFTALRSSNRDYSDIMSGKRLGTGIAILVAAIETAGQLDFLRFLRPLLMADSYFCILMFLILKNQQEIDTNIYHRRSITKTILPKNMRSFNFKASLALFAVIVLLFNLKPLIRLLTDAVKLVAGLIALGFLYIMEFISIFFTSGTDEKLNAVSPELPKVELVNVHPIVNFIGNVALKFILMYLAYRVILLLAEKLPLLFRKISDLLKRLFSFTDPKIIAVEEYSDEAEIVKPDSSKVKSRKSRHITRKNIRNIKAIKDPAERIRYTYGSLLGLLSNSGIKPEKSDTVSEILVKARAVNGIEAAFSELTGIYEEVRYGEAVPDGSTVLKADMDYEYAANCLREAGKHLSGKSFSPKSH